MWLKTAFLLLLPDKEIWSAMQFIFPFFKIISLTNSCTLIKPVRALWYCRLNLRYTHNHQKQNNLHSLLYFIRHMKTFVLNYFNLKQVNPMDNCWQTGISGSWLVIPLLQIELQHQHARLPWGVAILLIIILTLSYMRSRLILMEMILC